MDQDWTDKTELEKLIEQSNAIEKWRLYEAVVAHQAETPPEMREAKLELVAALKAVSDLIWEQIDGGIY